MSGANDDYVAWLKSQIERCNRHIKAATRKKQVAAAFVWDKQIYQQCLDRFTGQCDGGK